MAVGASFSPMASLAELSSSVERWRRRYLLGQDYSSKTVQTKCKNRRDLISPGKMDSSLDDTFSSLLINSSCPEHPYSGRNHTGKHYSDSSKNFINMGWLDEELDSRIDSSQFNIQPEFIKDSLESNEGQRTGIYTETDVTLPFGLVVATCSDCDGSGVVRETGSQALNGKSLVPSHFSQIYHELSIIYQKLQQENLIQQENSLKLEQRERLLMEREALLCKHEAALTKIRSVEEKVHAKFQIIKEQHEAEIQQLSEALKEKTKENKRLRSSFDTLKELNDTLKKQLSDVSEQNKKIEAQSRKVQARLENLQRKHEFLTVQKSKETSYAAQEYKPIKQEKLTAMSKTCKVPLNLHICDLLTVFMDWISDQHLRKLMHDDEKENIHRPTGTLSSNRSYTQEKCVKVLPLIAEQFQWMPFVNPNLHMQMVKFIYWAIRQLDGGTQHSTMISTLRRLGEDLFKGIASKGSHCVSSETAADLKPKTATFFKSGSLPLRVVSTLIIIKTVTQGVVFQAKGQKNTHLAYVFSMAQLSAGAIQKNFWTNGGRNVEAAIKLFIAKPLAQMLYGADYLAQAFDTLCMDLKTDEGKALFLDYEAVPIILSHMKISSKVLLSNAIDSLLQMTTESRFLHQFLEACSNESFFRTCSVLLRNSKLDVQVLEKLSILLQKLSKIKSNKKMFELFTVHLMIQELQRVTHPKHAFLCINLNSILFNLGLTKGNPLANSLNASH